MVDLGLGTCKHKKTRNGEEKATKIVWGEMKSRSGIYRAPKFFLIRRGVGLYAAAKFYYATE